MNLVMDDTGLKPFITSAEKYIQHVRISPDGNRALVEARGDIFSVPAENGYVKNLTGTTDAMERYASWSPDGRAIAYWSDKSGEYELWLLEPDKEGSPQKLTSFGPGFRYNLFWSPDSKKIAFIDKAMKIKIYDRDSKQTYDVDKALRFAQDNLEGFTCSWSADSRWLAYSRDMENYHNAIFLYNYPSKKLTQITTGFYNCYNPVFDPEGKYLYIATTQSFQPTYSDYDNTFIYANSTQLASISLQKGTPSLLAPKNDSVNIEQEEKKAEEKLKKPRKDTTGAIGPKTPIQPVNIDLDGLENRLVILPIPAGYYGTLAASKGRFIYLKYPAPGITEAKPVLNYYDLEKREEKTILENVSAFELSYKENKILVQRDNTWAVIKNDETQKFEKPLRMAEMQLRVDPRQEWKQLFTDTWRIERDFFYDPNMHGVNWNQVKERYGKMLEGAMTREEVDFILGEMLGELNASHTYHGGGDLQETKNLSVGYLGVDWQAEGEYYKIKKVLHGAAWDAEARSPLDVSGGLIKEGDYILAVNGVKITTDQEP
ncbi:MAG TPA: PDZ domain-containing protein, partial [Flavisolibacter sp.]|nr:PDZ domain-containing protein [Flavisolibacter sp.]